MDAEQKIARDFGVKIYLPLNMPGRKVIGLMGMPRAEDKGFEPLIGLTLYTLSKRAHSATMRILQCVDASKADQLAKGIGAQAMPRHLRLCQISGAALPR